MIDWRIVIRPLLEENMFNAKEGEIIIDKYTGHVTIKHKGKYISKTKELEARVNALLGLKNDLVKKFIELAEEIDILVKGFEAVVDDAKDVIIESEELYSELMELELSIENLLSQIDRFCLDIKEYQYEEFRQHLNPVIDNLREIIKLRAVLDELTFLASDIQNQKLSNNAGIAILE
jgi:molecular chaperone GrpE (heat shock protein)